MAQKQQKRKGKAISEFLPLSVELPSWKPTMMKTQLSSTSDAIPIGVNSRGSSVRVLQACSLVIYMTFLSKMTVKNVLWLMHLKLSTQSLKTDPTGNVFCESLKRKAMKQCKISVAAMIHSI